MAGAGERPGREGEDMRAGFELTDDTPVYVISVAARLSGLHPQTLRAYDRLGLVSPGGRPPGSPLLAARRPDPARGSAPVAGDEVDLSGVKRILELEWSGGAAS